MRPVVGGSAGNDSVELVGITLRLHQSLASAIRAADKIAPRRVAPIERANDRFGLNACLVYRAISEIDQLLRMADGPGCAASSLVTIVSAGDGIAAGERIDEIPIRNGTSPSTVSNLNILAVPARRWKPQGKFDLGIFCRTSDRLHFAARRPNDGDGIGKWSGRHRGRRRDGRVRQLQTGQ